MANNDSSNGSKGLNLGEIGMIRNILMGEQIGEFEQKFNALQEQIQTLEKELSSRIENLDQSTQKSFSEMDKNTKNSFAESEKQIANHIEKINNRIDKVSKDDKMRLGKMLDKVSKQLMGE